MVVTEQVVLVRGIDAYNYLLALAVEPVSSTSRRRNTS